MRINTLTRLLMTVISLLTLFVSNAVHAQSWIDGIVDLYYTDPFWFWVELLGIITLVLVVVFGVMALIGHLNDIRNQNAVTNAQVEGIHVNNNATAQLTTAITNAINVNTAMYQREVDHRINTENRYLDIYERLVNHTIWFQDALLNLYAQQLTTQDIRQLMSDKIKAAVIQNTNPPTIETYHVQTSTPGPLPQTQQGGQGTTPTK